MKRQSWRVNFSYLRTMLALNIYWKQDNKRQKLRKSIYSSFSSCSCHDSYFCCIIIIIITIIGPDFVSNSLLTPLSSLCKSAWLVISVKSFHANGYHLLQCFKTLTTKVQYKHSVDTRQQGFSEGCKFQG